VAQTLGREGILPTRPEHPAECASEAHDAVALFARPPGAAPAQLLQTRNLSDLASRTHARTHARASGDANQSYHSCAINTRLLLWAALVSPRTGDCRTGLGHTHSRSPFVAWWVGRIGRGNSGRLRNTQCNALEIWVGSVCLIGPRSPTTTTVVPHPMVMQSSQ
jgi:hypothetical protein